MSDNKEELVGATTIKVWILATSTGEPRPGELVIVGDLMKADEGATP